jgi:conjugative transfer region protein TrbK
MGSFLTYSALFRVVAVVFVTLVAAVAVIRNQTEDPAILAPPKFAEPDALASLLARCRTVTSEDAADLTDCPGIWAESCRHFFHASKSSRLSSSPVPNAPDELMKSKEQVLRHDVEQGRGR